MEPISSRSPIVTAAPEPFRPSEDEFHARLGALYARSQENNHLFASPLGPFHFGDQPGWLPRFVFFGPRASDTWRLALLAGFDHCDLRGSYALLNFIGRLAARAESGNELNLALFPLVDAAGLAFQTPPRHLTTAHWSHNPAPEIELLEKDARQQGYHGFIRIEAAAPGEEVIVIRIREPAATHPTPDVELIATEEIDPYPVRFELGTHGVVPVDGPLSIADDLPMQPFELTLFIPPGWSEDVFANAVDRILTRFLRRYRAFQGFGGHL